MISPRFVVILALCSSAMAVPRVAHADDPAMRSARRHYDRGEKLFALGKFSEALDEYQRAFDAKPVPEFLFNIGQCHRNLGDYDAAIFSFKKYLKLEPDAPNREKVEKLIDELEAKKGRDDTQHFGLIKKPPPPPPPPAETPIYGKWWFWTGIAVVGAAGGVGIYEATKPGGPPATTLGNIVVGK
jgi:tetratricopeptide (TPR) repeat protein